MNASEYHVLVVDDEEILRDSMAFALEQEGFNVKQASCGNDAWEIVKNGAQIDLIVSDVRMHNGNGIELLVRVKKMADHVPIVLLVTGFSDISDTDAIDKGARAVLKKPFKPTDLISEVKNAILTSQLQGKVEA